MKINSAGLAATVSPTTGGPFRRWIVALQFALSIAALAVLAACALSNPAANPLGALQDLVHLGQSVVEMKTVADVKGSFVLRASDLLFPDGLTPSPEQVPQLTSAQLRKVDGFFAQRIDAVQSLTLSLVATHPKYSGSGGAPSRFASVKFIAQGQPHAVVDSDGVLLVDVSVVQAVLRAVIIHWQAGGGLEANNGFLGGFSMLTGPKRFDLDALSKPLPPADELRAIVAFNAFRREVHDAAPTMELGVLIKTIQGAKGKGDTLTGVGRALGGKPDLMDRALFRMMDGMEAQMAEQSRLVAARYAQETFESALDFLIAHEIAHRLFGHVAKREAAVDAVQACAIGRGQELAADEFAAVLLVQQQLAGSRPARIVETGNGFQQDGAATIPSIDGGSLFLATAYRLAGFGQQLVAGGCSYPPVAQRLADIGLVLAMGEGGNQSGLVYEGLMAGSWRRAKDNARLAELVGDERSERYKNLPSQQVQRVRQLVSPMVEARFKDRI